MIQVAEAFHSVQGEGLHTGVPMLFIRFVGCSVGKKICQHCDTDFDKVYPWLDGGNYELADLERMLKKYGAHRICFTGGEPFDQPEFRVILERLYWQAKVHVESSGTVDPGKDFPWFMIEHLCISPKPGWKPEMISRANEVKVIVGGLGNGPGWPTLEDALDWATRSDRPVYLQPRNKKWDVDPDQLKLAESLVMQHPELRLSVQMHKILRVR